MIPYFEKALSIVKREISFFYLTNYLMSILFDAIVIVIVTVT